MRKFLFTLITLFILINTSFALSEKEKKCYANAMRQLLDLSFFAKENTIIFQNLYFHLVEVRKINACKALKEFESIVKKMNKI